MGNQLHTQVDLLHADRARVVVRVSCQAAGGVVAALGEATGAEEAEDRARARLLLRLGQAMPQASIQKATIEQKASIEIESVALAEPPIEPISEPEDWSEELTAVEMELQRLSWDRQQEGIYLERCFGHASRNRIVRYADLTAYLKALRILEPPISAGSAELPLLRSALLKASDELLGQLAWGAEQGRSFLNEHFGHTSRIQLSDDQLSQFNQLMQQQLGSSSD
jgi:hypothetical protein